jgi:thiamine transporter
MTQLRGQLNGCRPIEPEPGNTGGGNKEVNGTNQNEIKNQNKYRNPLILTEIAIFTALATILYTIKIYHMPQGGSITLVSMVPIILLAFRRGPKIGIATGVLFGMIRFMLSPSAINPLQVLLEYPIAFAVLGFAAFFQNRQILGSSIAIACRFLIHLIVGAVWWAPVYGAGLNPIVYSAIYNGSYLLPELVISGVAIFLLQKRNIIKTFLIRRDKKRD